MNIRMLAAVAYLAAAPALADDDFFKGKTITIVNSTGNGGSYFNIAQAVARHMPRFIPGHPAMAVKSMPGGGNVLATSFMYQNAPRDGTYIATINNSIPLNQAIDPRGARYDADKFNWLGSTGTYNSVAYVWRTAGVASVGDVFKREIVLGGTGVGSSVVIYPSVMNNLLGAKFKIVLGYNTTTEIDLAMERGEVQARTGSYSGLLDDHPDWVRDGKVNVVLQIGGARDPALKNVPLLTELARNVEEERILRLVSSPIALGRPYLAPPETPPERVAILREAFAATMLDRDFRADMARMGHEIQPSSAEEVARIVADTVNAPADIVARAREAMGGVAVGP